MLPGRAGGFLMDRRGFLGLIASAVPAALILPELLLPTRTFFLPPAGGWAQPSLTEMWLNYANEIRPAGVLVTAAISLIRQPMIYERGPGHVELVMPEETDAALRARVLAALRKPPHSNSYGVTIADLMPWVEA